MDIKSAVCRSRALVTIASNGRRLKHEEHEPSMGTFSVRNLRADIQNISAMKHGRAFPNLLRFITCYLCACVAVYLYFRYYLMDESDYGIPPPALVVHDNPFRPLETFSSSEMAVSPNELFEKLRSKYRARKRPGILERVDGYNWHKSNDDVIARLEDSLEENYNFQSFPVDKKEVEKGSVDDSSSSVRHFNFSKYSIASDQSEDLKRRQNDTWIPENSTRDQANISSVAPKSRNNKLDLKMVQVIPNPETEQNSSISYRFQDFRHQWLRQRRARVDWQSVIKPCIDNMAWGQVKTHWSKLNRSSAVASDVMFWDIRPAGEFSKIFIQSKTSDHRTKLIGGDTWRVYVRGPSSVAVTIFDHNNGTYEALFLIMEPGVYQLLIYLDYSLCDGFKDPPRDWFIKGNAQGKYQKEGLLGTLDDYLKQPFKNGSDLK
ncbi:hypothetical protein OS493_007540 [Desmophyllum pertusum]|uniref:Uncharacterized protein n=1 Tax=Desmophyllum pertusum TaxID=174260 RepID=A0A9W9Z4X3_9CNID|nr:hypothetical protein OS493_007540 [Desmophyllum pertusum]